MQVSQQDVALGLLTVVGVLGLGMVAGMALVIGWGRKIIRWWRNSGQVWCPGCHGWVPRHKMRSIPQWNLWHCAVCDQLIDAEEDGECDN